MSAAPRPLLGARPAQSRAGLALVVCWLAVLAATWTLRTASGLVPQMLNLVLVYSGVAGLVVALVRSPRFPAERLTALVLVLGAVGWYFSKVLLAPEPAVFWQHVGNLLGGVLPGLVLGALVGLAASDLVVGREPAAQSSAQLMWFDRILVLDGITVALLAIYLLANTLDDVLLVSTELLAGAETYQTIGDALTVNLLSAYLLARVRRRVGYDPRRALGLLGLPLLCVATLGCAVLTGSNKLLLVAAGVLLAVALPSLGAAWRRRPGWTTAGTLSALALALTLIAFVGGLDDVLALTRLLDYGQVDSILDTPSLASRSEILAACGALQFSYAPVLGEIAAEHLSCGPGNYVHSLLSVQSHLGGVGSLLLIAVLARGAWAVRSDDAYRPMWTIGGLVLLVGLLAAFFAWLPFWYLLGAATGIRAHPSSLRAGAQMSASPATLKRTP